MREEKLNYEYLAFLQEQMEDCKSKDFPNKIGDDKDDTTQYLCLWMCWEKYLNIQAGLYQTINEKEFKEVWNKTEDYREKVSLANENRRDSGL